MTKPWMSVTDEEILDFDGGQTGTMARYERIMQHRSHVELRNLAHMLQGVMQSVHRASLLVGEKADAAITKADEAIARYDAASVEQRKQQTTMRRLTVVLAVATVLYTIINGIGVFQSWRANQLQEQSLELTRAQLSRSSAAPSPTGDAGPRNPRP